MYDEPFHVWAEGNTRDWEWYPSTIRSWVRQEHVPPPYFAATTPTLQNLPPLPYPMKQALAAFVATMDREIQNMRDVAGEITGLLERESQANENIEKLIEFNLDVAHTRIEQLETQLEAAIATEDAQDVEPEEEPAEDKDDESVISLANSSI
ncbi:hypothetical protein L1987_13006 [Smallanthus sonchifolius]|uniref:Uncharacterized protein n=1 Tax=Smallanthus sonchifolius TaxID=185202 RepID=A0ACB9JHM1_9ASTR|nr:hypothetical protein L1987_13006 [Smallanthus sonchifolius]